MTSKGMRKYKNDMDRFIPSYKEAFGIRGLPNKVVDSSPVQNENLKQIFLHSQRKVLKFGSK